MTKQERKVVVAARRLMRLIGENVGTNADWPIRITSAEDITPALCYRLNMLQLALKPYERRVDKKAERWNSPPR